MPVGFEPHNHAKCVSDGIQSVADVCAREGLQFTEIRRRVLEILLSEHRAVGAYEILDILQAEGKKSQPPVAYRALDFLVSNGFAHKVERLNAFTACTEPGCGHSPVFLICRECDAVVEAQAGNLRQALETLAEGTGFRVEKPVVELQGVCPSCLETATADQTDVAAKA